MSPSFVVNFFSVITRGCSFFFVVITITAINAIGNNCALAQEIIDEKAKTASYASSPNILLIMTDDQGFGDVASHGNKYIDTPNHDLLAEQGARFDRFFVSPVCAPTRAALLTGRYHPRTGVHGVTRGRETMRADEVTIAEIFQQNGYATAAFGKWHNGAHFPHHPNGQGFNKFVGFCAGHWNNYFDTSLEQNGKSIKTQGFIIDVLTDHAIRWIGKQNKNKKPWFCYVPYNTPHTPWQVPEKQWKKYQNLGLTKEAVCAYAMVENLDNNLGKLLKCVDEIGQKNNTIVIFLSDNGANSDRFNAGMKGRKASNDEGGSRVPFFIRYPGVIPAGKVVKPIAAHIDLLPTLIDLTGAKFTPKKPIDGKSLVPLLTGDNCEWLERTLFTKWRNRGAVRTERWRAVNAQKQKGSRNRWALFDMQKDPGQTTDLAIKNQQKLKELRTKYQQWINDVTSDGFPPIPTEIGHPESPRVSLAGHEAFLKPEQTKGISYVGKNGWANDYIINWSDINAYPSWPVRLVETGRYQISIDYACDVNSIGSILQADWAGKKITFTITEAFPGEQVSSPDRIPRKEVFERTWKRAELGVIEIDQLGDCELSLRGKTKPGKLFPRIKTVIVERIK